MRRRGKSGFRNQPPPPPCPLLWPASASEQVLFPFFFSSVDSKVATRAEQVVPGSTKGVSFFLCKGVVRGSVRRGKLGRDLVLVKIQARPRVFVEVR